MCVCVGDVGLGICMCVCVCLCWGCGRGVGYLYVCVCVCVGDGGVGLGICMCVCVCINMFSLQGSLCDSPSHVSDEPESTHTGVHYADHLSLLQGHVRLLILHVYVVVYTP